MALQPLFIRGWKQLSAYNAINPLKNSGYAVLVVYKTLAIAERILS